MQLRQFENLELNAKACLVWKEGINMGYRAQGHYYMTLYCLNDFYVEMCYHTGYDKVASIHAFACQEQLQPYLDMVDLSEILQLF